MKYWCQGCDEERSGEWINFRPFGPFSPPRRIFACECCGEPLVEAGECIYCGEPCDPDAEPQLCPECRFDLEKVINRVINSLSTGEDGENPTIEDKINALYALASLMDVMREEMERQVIRDAKRGNAAKNKQQHKNDPH